MKNTKHRVSPHFSIEALKQRYLRCECPRERMRWHAIWLLADTCQNYNLPNDFGLCLREVVANRVLQTLSSLEKVLVNRCQWFSKNWDIVQPHVGFQWICEIEKQYESS